MLSRLFDAIIQLFSSRFDNDLSASIDELLCI